MKLITLLGALAALCANTALAQSSSFTVRVPSGLAEFRPALQRVDFGRVAVGSQPTHVFTLNNNTVLAQEVGTPEALGQARLVAHSCPSVLGPGQRCTLTVGLDVVAVGAVGALVRVPVGNGQLSETLQVSAEGVSPSGLLDVAPARVDFGAVSLGQLSAPVTVTLTNKASTPVSTAGIALKSDSSGAFKLSSSCPTLLAGGASCTLSLRFGPTVAGIQQSRATVGAALPWHLFSVTGEGVRAEAVWSVPRITFDSAMAGALSAPQTVVLTNVGRAALAAPALRVDNPTVFKVLEQTCGSGLEPGQSCTFRIAALLPDSQPRSGRLTLPPTTVFSGASLDLQASPRVSNSALVVEPASLDFGDVPVGGTSASRTLTLTAVGATPVAVTRQSITGVPASRFSVVEPVKCIGLLAPGSQCSLQLVARPVSIGQVSASWQVTTSAAQPLLPIVLRARGTEGVLLSAPQALTFEEAQVGETVRRSVTLVNAGDGPLYVGMLNMQGSNAASFAASGCSGSMLAPGQTCQVNVQFTAVDGHPRTATLQVMHAGRGGALLVPLAGRPLIPAPGMLGTPVCEAPVLHPATTRCRVALANVSAVGLSLPQVPVIGVNADPRRLNGATIPGVTRLNRCFVGSTTLAPGGRCVHEFLTTFPKQGPNTLAFVLEGTNAGTLYSQATITVSAPQVSLLAGTHAPTSVGALSRGAHRLVNTGTTAVRLPATAGPSLARVTGATGLAFDTSTAGSDCPLILEPGASCLLHTLCRSNTPAALAGTLQVSVVGQSPAPGVPVSCSVEAPSVRVEPAGALSTRVGAWSNSGNYHRVTNTSAAAVVFQGVVTESSAWLALTDSRDASHCSRGKTLAPGASCLFLTELLEAAPGTTATGLQRIRLSGGSFSFERLFTDRLSVEGASVTLTAPFPAVAAGARQEATYTVTNLAPYPLSSMSFALSAKSIFTLDRHSCSAGLGAAGQAGSTCTVTMRAMSAQPGTFTGTLLVSGGYPQVINDRPGVVVRTGVQARAELSVQVQPDRLQLQPGAHAATLAGSSSTATSILTNAGVGPVSLSSLAISPASFSISGGTCAVGRTLAAGESCTVQTRFSATSNDYPVTEGTLRAAGGLTDTRATIRAETLMSGDVSISVTNKQPRLSYRDSTFFEFVVTNRSRVRASVLFVSAVNASAPGVGSPTYFTWKQTPGTVYGNVTNGNLPLALEPGASAVLYQTVTAGTVSGMLYVRGSIVVTGLLDTTPNNSVESMASVSEATDNVLYGLPNLTELDFYSNGTHFRTVRLSHTDVMGVWPILNGQVFLSSPVPEHQSIASWTCLPTQASAGSGCSDDGRFWISHRGWVVFKLAIRRPSGGAASLRDARMLMRGPSAHCNIHSYDDYTASRHHCYNRP